MMAPNCEADKFKPTAVHETPYFFSPASAVFDSFKGNGGQPVPKRAKTAKVRPVKPDCS